jgi:chaperonin cofactor prefoldin
MFEDNTLERAKDGLEDMKTEAEKGFDALRDENGNLDEKLTELELALMARFEDAEDAMARLNDKAGEVRRYITQCDTEAVA